MTLLQTEHKSFVRDMNSRALLQTDRSLADDYKSRRKMLNKQKIIEDDITTLKNDMNEIKELLKGLVK